MKRLLPAFALVCLLAVPSIAGDTNGPGKTEPPPPPPACTENCTNSATTEIDPLALIEALLDVLLIIPG